MRREVSQLFGLSVKGIILVPDGRFFNCDSVVLVFEYGLFVFECIFESVDDKIFVVDLSNEFIDFPLEF